MDEKDTLVVLAITAVVIVLLVLFMVRIMNVGESASDSACAISVATRAQSLRFTDSFTTPLECYTTARDFPATMSQQAFERQVLLDYSACYRDFSAAYTHTLIKQEDTFCFVCNLYTIEGERVIEDFHTKAIRDKPAFTVIDEGEDLEADLELTGNVAILFMQQRVDERARLNKMYQAVHGQATTLPAGVATGIGAGVTVARMIPKFRVASYAVGISLGGTTGAAAGYALGKFLSEHEVQSDIIITPYTQEVLDEVGCTMFTKG